MRMIDADALLEKFNRETDIWTALTGKDTASDFAFYCKLADAVEEMPTIGGWISVKDRLPEQYEKTFRGILARNGEEIVKTRIVSDEVLVSYLNKYGRRKIGISYMLDGEWSGMFRSLAEIDVFTKAITHWQPLPEMPENGEA